MTDNTPSPDPVSPSERLTRALRGLDDADLQLEAPPGSVWEAIATEVGTTGRPDEQPVEAVTAPPTRRVPGAAKILGIAAAVALLAVAALSLPILEQRAPSAPLVVAVPEPKPDVAVAVADLEALEPGVQGTTARLLDDATMVVRPDLAAQQSGYYEVWLLDASAAQLISLGPLREDGRYAIPQGVSIEDFPVVDISVEATDGNPAHSGRSVLRGTLA